MLRASALTLRTVTSAMRWSDVFMGGVGRDPRALGALLATDCPWRAAHNMASLHHSGPPAFT
jgi:hypothetical protein